MLARYSYAGDIGPLPLLIFHLKKLSLSLTFLGPPISYAPFSHSAHLYTRLYLKNIVTEKNEQFHQPPNGLSALKSTHPTPFFSPNPIVPPE